MQVQGNFIIIMENTFFSNKKERCEYLCLNITNWNDKFFINIFKGLNKKF